MCLSKPNNSCCCFISIISALLSAFGISNLFTTGLVTSPIIIYVTLGLGILMTLYFLFQIFCCKKRFDFSKLCILPVVVGSIILSAIALSILTTATIATLAGLIGAIAFFLFMMIFHLINTIFSIFTTNSCD